MNADAKLPHSPRSTAPYRRRFRWWRRVIYFILLLGLMFSYLRPGYMLSWFKPALLTRDGALTPAGHAQLQEIADLMDEIYTTLSKMHFIPSSAVVRPPHDPPIDLNLAKDLELDPLIVHLYQMLPYVDTEQGANPDFIFGGTFADFRRGEDVEQSRDPFYGGWDMEEEDKRGWDDENGMYIRPWVTPLTMMGNHQSVIIYDARENRIWIIDQEGWSSTDPALRNVPEFQIKSKNRNNFDHMPSRPAPEVLRDILNRYVTLEEIPGGEHSGGFWDYEPMKAIYLKNGWPDNFDGHQFNIDHIRVEARESAVHEAEDPVREVQKYDQWSKSRLGWDEKIEQAQDNLARAMSTDDKYACEWELKRLRMEEEVSRHMIKFLGEKAREKARKYCPSGICVRKGDEIRWELRRLKRDLKEQQAIVQQIDRDDAEGERSNEDKEKLRFLGTALEQCQEEVDRLCAQRTCEPLLAQTKKDRNSERVIELREHIENNQEILRRTREWLLELPKEAVTAKNRMLDLIQQTEITTHQLDEKMHGYENDVTDGNSDDE